MQENKSIAILGSGSWATALTKVLTDNQVAVHWLIPKKERREAILAEGKNPHYLHDVLLDTQMLTIHDNAASCLHATDQLLVAVPAAFLESSLEQADPDRVREMKVLSTIKGMIPEKNETISEFFQSRFGLGKKRFALLSGPSHAEEVATGKRTFLAVASDNNELALQFASLFSVPHLHVSISKDVKGIETAGILKNIYAIAAGILSGLKLGDNILAVLVSYALKEMDICLQTLFPIERNLFEAAYTGDLLVTAYSEHSRNRTLGRLMALGHTPESAMTKMNMVAEGYYAVGGIIQRTQSLSIDLPIVRMVHQVLYQEVPPEKAFNELLKLFH